MFKNLFRLTVIGYLWKRYKAFIVSTLLLLLYFWVVGQVHDDYVSYANLNADKEFIGLSFIVKWIAFAVGCLVYFILNTWYFSIGKPQDDLKKEPFRLFRQNEAHQQSTGLENSVNEIDPFDTIRKKTKLRSKADLIIEKNKPE